MSNVPMAVIIATKNRSAEIAQYALASLERSAFRDFVCVVWDASDDERTREVAEGVAWTFPLRYFRAPRSGLTSQRNDAVDYVLRCLPSVRYVLFIDDDSELSRHALEGLRISFENKEIWGVNVPHVFAIRERHQSKVEPNAVSRSRVMTSYLHNKSSCPEEQGIEVEWLSGCSMAFRREVFEELGLRFPEEFQRFGGYSLGEDVALSFYLHKKMNKKLVNSCLGMLCHHAAQGARLNVANMAASKWYNFHLLFDCIYDDVHGARLFWLKFKFKLFMVVAVFKLLLRARSFDLAFLIEGVSEANAALRKFRLSSNGLFKSK